LVSEVRKDARSGDEAKLAWRDGHPPQSRSCSDLVATDQERLYPFVVHADDIGYP
jgi:hypothetical protein